MLGALLRPAAVCLVVLALVPMGTARAHAPRQVAAVAAACEDRFTRTELFFGSAKPDGSAVTEEDFGRFVDGEVTPRFPDGLTMLVGSGQFKNGTGGIVRERSFVLILLHSRPTPATSASIDAIREAYRTRFAQDSVLRVDSQTTRVCF